MKPRVYLESSVVRCLSGRLSHDLRTLCDQLDARDWWQHAPARFELVASPLVVDEERVGNHQSGHGSRTALRSLRIVRPSDASEILVQRLIDSRALPEEATQDAAHVAIAVTNGVEYLATWNFLHIANPANASKINLVCRESGYRPTVICTPAQLVGVQGDQPTDDPMIAEIRGYRDKQAARFGYDAAAIVRHYRDLLEVSGRRSVQYPPRRLVATSDPERMSGSRPNGTMPSGAA